MNATRYPVAVMLRARELRDAEWTTRDIARLIEREHGLKPSPNTIWVWCRSEDKDELRRLSDANKKACARRRLAGLRPRADRSPEWKQQRMRELRDRNVSFTAIGQVAAVWWGEELTEHQVKGRLAGKRAYEKRTV